MPRGPALFQLQQIALGITHIEDQTGGVVGPKIRDLALLCAAQPQDRSDGCVQVRNLERKVTQAAFIDSRGSAVNDVMVLQDFQKRPVIVGQGQPDRKDIGPWQAIPTRDL